MQRCYNPNQCGYRDYGERGIKVCERWHNVANFIEDMGVYQKGMSIERIDFNGDYEPTNCKWIPKNEQSRNRRNVIKVLVEGKTMLLKEAAEFLGLSIWQARNNLERLN